MLRTTGVPMKRMLAGLAVSGVFALFAQTPSARAKFEVVSIRPSNTGQPRTTIRTEPGGRWIGTNVSVRMLVQNAYGVREDQLTGGPGWISSEGFDITAKLEGESGSPAQFQQALQGMLEERFQL